MEIIFLIISIVNKLLQSYSLNFITAVKSISSLLKCLYSIRNSERFNKLSAKCPKMC